MLPIFDDYLKMLKDFDIDLSKYDKNKLWIDRLIVRGFDRNGNVHKICRLSVTDDLKYIYKFYDKLPDNDMLETWEETYQRLKSQIAEKEKYSLELLKNKIPEFYDNGYKIVITNSMGKDSKLVEFLYNKATNIPKEVVFNNTTLDCADVYREAKSRKDVKIITPIDKDGKYKSFFKLVTTTTTTPSRFNRFCCSIFKEKPTEDYYDDVEKILFVYGMRNDESDKRKDYQDVIHNDKWNKKHSQWYGILPIRKWTEIELWLYTIHNNIPINSKYFKGYHRCGCQCACPYYNKSTWVLDKYWYINQFNNWRKLVKQDFINGEKWTRMNCTLDEYYLNWNGGQVRKEPTEEVIKEFQEYKGFQTYELAQQYFLKKCDVCGKNVYRKNEVAMNLKMYGRNINKFLCKKCLCSDLQWNDDDWDTMVKKFKDQSCQLF